MVIQITVSLVMRSPPLLYCFKPQRFKATNIMLQDSRGNCKDFFKNKGVFPLLLAQILLSLLRKSGKRLYVWRSSPAFAARCQIPAAFSALISIHFRRPRYESHPRPPIASRSNQIPFSPQSRPRSLLTGMIAFHGDRPGSRCFSRSPVSFPPFPGSNLYVLLSFCDDILFGYRHPALICR